MLQAEDLMKGDWVLINGTPRKIQAVDGVDDEIMADDELYTLAKDRYHSEDKVDGVPLTPEILEKNGWRQYGPDFSNDNADFELEPYRDGGFGIRVSADEYGSGTFACIKYVHQLQHALRLCGIEKEIVL